MEPNRQPFIRVPVGAIALLVGVTIALLAACTPGSGLPTQGTTGPTASSPEPSPGTPSATGSTGGSVVPVINF